MKDKESQTCVKCGHLKLNPWRGYCKHEVTPFGKRPVRYCGCKCEFSSSTESQSELLPPERIWIEPSGTGSISLTPQDGDVAYVPEVPTSAPDDARVKEIQEQASAATQLHDKVITRTRYDNGGGRMYVENTNRTLIGDFYNEGDREFYFYALDSVRYLLSLLASQQSQERK